MLLQALSNAQNISWDSSRSEALSKIATASASLQDQEKAKELLLQALSDAQNISDDKYRSQALSTIATAFFKSGHHKEAFFVLECLTAHNSFFKGAVKDFTEFITSTDQIFDLLRVASKAGKVTYIESLIILMPVITKIDKEKAREVLPYLHKELEKIMNVNE